MENKKSIKINLSIFILVLVLVLIGIIVIRKSKNIEETKQMQVFISDDVTEEQIQVFISNDATEEQIKELGSEIKKIEGVNIEKIEYISKEVALEQMKEKFQDKAYLLNGYEKNNIFPASYIVTISDKKLSNYVQQKIIELDNVKEIKIKNK